MSMVLHSSMWCYWSTHMLQMLTLHLRLTLPCCQSLALQQH